MLTPEQIAASALADLINIPSSSNSDVALVSSDEELSKSTTVAGTDVHHSSRQKRSSKDLVSPESSSSTSVGPTSGDEANKPRRKRAKRGEPKLPIQPISIQIVNPARGQVDHSYRDYSTITAEICGHDINADEEPDCIGAMSFPQKLHHILSQDDDEIRGWISWESHGRAFKVHKPVQFEKHVCPVYFGHHRYSSFLRQLTNHGFKILTKGLERNAHYHELMLRGMPHLTKFIKSYVNGRNWLPDPDNEPDLNDITRRYPLPLKNPEKVDASHCKIVPCQSSHDKEKQNQGGNDTLFSSKKLSDKLISPMLYPSIMEPRHTTVLSGFSSSAQLPTYVPSDILASVALLSAGSGERHYGTPRANVDISIIDSSLYGGVKSAGANPTFDFKFALDTHDNTKHAAVTAAQHEILLNRIRCSFPNQPSSTSNIKLPDPSSIALAGSIAEFLRGQKSNYTM